LERMFSAGSWTREMLRSAIYSLDLLRPRQHRATSSPTAAELTPAFATDKPI